MSEAQLKHIFKQLKNTTDVFFPPRMILILIDNIQNKPIFMQSYLLIEPLNFHDIQRHKT